MRIPRVAHFVFGLQPQPEPFHFLHYLAIESCRRTLGPETIYFHHRHLPWGPWWERIRPHLTLAEVDEVPDVRAADYSAGHVPGRYRYAHHADFIRLDVLIEHGGIYADIDTIFVRRFPDELFDAPFVIGREPHVRDEITGESRPSLCNALVMAEPGAEFAIAWREQMPDALNGTWSNHSGFLAAELARLGPATLRIEPEISFFPFPASRAGLSMLLQERHALPAASLSIHLWAHLWWHRGRRDFSPAHSEWCTPPFLRTACTTLADLARPYLPPPVRDGHSKWSYLWLDDDSGYGVAAERCIAALEQSGLEVEREPFIPGPGWRLGYQPALALDEHAPVVVAHLVPEYLPLVRERTPDAFLVAHTVWETDRIPGHWVANLETADLVVVPSRLSLDAIAASAVRTPIAVVPHVATPPVAGPAASWDWVPADTLVFYTIAEWNERKAVYRTIEAYLEAFSARDRVLLIVKTSYRDRNARAPSAGRAGPGTTAWSLARLMAGHDDPPAVRLITRSLAPADIGSLHARGDVFVSLCRSEGWGLGAFDAAAYGNPVVSTGYGGHLDYLRDTPYLVDFKLVAVNDPGGYPSYAPDQRWAEPDVGHGASLLREIAADPERAKSQASALAADIRWRFRPAAIAEQFRSAVEQHRSGSARPPEPQLSSEAPPAVGDRGTPRPR